MTDIMTGLRQKYLDAIRELNAEELEYALPSPSYCNFQPLMKGIIDELNKEISEWRSTAASFQEAEDIAECEREARAVETKLRICEELLRQSFSIEDTPSQEESVTNETAYNLVFGVNPAGNISFQKDLERDIDHHYYEQLIDLLESLEYGSNTGNIEKRRKLGSSADNLRGILEVKGFQIRILYRELPNNILYIEMIRVKKDDWSLKDRKEIETRDSLLSKDYSQLKKRIKQKDRIEELIIENQEILANIKEHIRKNTIGRNKNNG